MTERKGAKQIAAYKKKVVAEFSTLLKEYPIVGVVNMESLPAPQLQKMRSQLRGKVVIKMTKKNYIKFAIESVKDSKKNIEKLEEYFRGMPALLFTKDNPFSLFSTLKKSKSNAPAKAGQTAPNDIKIGAGPTPFAPGPVIGELGALGLQTGVENGKVAIKADKVVVKEGEVIKENVASVLARLGIEPMEIGLDLVATYENGIIYDKSTLDIDEDQFKADLGTAATWAFNLAVEAKYPTKETTELFIIQAFTDAKGLSIEASIPTKDTISNILARAAGQAASLKTEAKL